MVFIYRRIFESNIKRKNKGMKQALIKLSKKVEIDCNSDWEKAESFHSNSFNELKTNFSFGQHPYNTWQELKKNIPDSISPLENAVQKAIMNNIYSLKSKVPNGFFDVTENIDLPFIEFKFNILESDIRDINKHKIQFQFITDYLTLIDSFENKILLAFGDKSNELLSSIELNTFTIELNENTGISSYKKLGE